MGFGDEPSVVCRRNTRSLGHRTLQVILHTKLLRFNEYGSQPSSISQETIVGINQRQGIRSSQLSDFPIQLKTSRGLVRGERLLQFLSGSASTTQAKSWKDLEPSFKPWSLSRFSLYRERPSHHVSSRNPHHNLHSPI